MSLRVVPAEKSQYKPNQRHRTLHVVPEGSTHAFCGTTTQEGGGWTYHPGAFEARLCTRCRNKAMKLEAADA